MSLESEFLDFSAEKILQLASRIEDCLSRLTTDQLWLRQSENENAVGNLVLHLCGNVRQWIISGAGGTPYIRKRDEEFAARGGVSGAELQERLRETVNEAAQVLRSLPHSRLAATVSIQGFNGSILGAIYHCVEHFSMHTGQIIFATKLFTGADLGYYAHLRNPSHGQKTP